MNCILTLQPDWLQVSPNKMGLHLLLQHHDHLGVGVVGAETLDEFWVVKQLHQFDLLAGRRPLLGGPGSVEFARAHLACLLVAQPEDLAELPAANMKHWNVTLCIP